jgi:hypothetical protein
MIIGEYLDEVVAESTRYREKRQVLKRQYLSTFTALRHCRAEFFVGFVFFIPVP